MLYFLFEYVESLDAISHTTDETAILHCQLTYSWPIIDNRNIEKLEGKGQKIKRKMAAVEIRPRVEIFTVIVFRIGSYSGGIFVGKVVPIVPAD